MKRRDFLAFLATAAAWHSPASAQRSTLPFIGFLSSGTPKEWMHLVEAFRRGLKEAGYIDGKDVAIEYRWAEGRYDRLPALAKELVEREVAVIVATGGPAPALAAKAATATIPIVFSAGGVDPIKAGLVKSLSRPGENLTGIYNLAGSLDAKRLELLRDLVPSAGRIAYLINPAGPNARNVKDVQAAAKAARTHLEIVNASHEGEFESAFAAAKKAGAAALLVGTDAVFVTRRDQVVALAGHHAIPAAYPFREFPMAGGLISYGADLREIYRQAGVYTARVLKGAKPGELPVVQAQKFEMVLNLKTAKKLKLTLSREFLARVDEVIE